MVTATHKQKEEHCPRAGAGTHCFSVDNLHAHYGGLCALRDISFDATCGRAIALVGGNGAGKTTLMKAIVGLVPSCTGTVRWRGEPVHKSTYEIAYLPQREDLDRDFPITVRGLVELGRYPLVGMLKRMRAEDEDAIERAMDMMGVRELRHRQIGALSGGQQQRVFIARALAQDAHVLLLDEPFAGLDQPSCDILADLLRKLAAQGSLVIASHHDMRTVEDIFDEMLLINKRMIAYGKPTDVLTEDNLEAAFG